MNEAGACIVRRDRTILLECAHPGFETARKELGVFAELVKSPPAYHTYRITPLSLWNAASLNHSAEEIISSLHQLALLGGSRWTRRRDRNSFVQIWKTDTSRSGDSE